MNGFNEFIKTLEDRIWLYDNCIHFQNTYSDLQFTSNLESKFDIMVNEAKQKNPKFKNIKSFGVEIEAKFDSNPYDLHSDYIERYEEECSLDFNEDFLCDYCINEEGEDCNGNCIHCLNECECYLDRDSNYIGELITVPFYNLETHDNMYDYVYNRVGYQTNYSCGQHFTFVLNNTDLYSRFADYNNVQYFQNLLYVIGKLLPIRKDSFYERLSNGSRWSNNIDNNQVIADQLLQLEKGSECRYHIFNFKNGYLENGVECRVLPMFESLHIQKLVNRLALMSIDWIISNRLVTKKRYFRQKIKPQIFKRKFNHSMQESKIIRVDQ